MIRVDLSVLGNAGLWYHVTGRSIVEGISTLETNRITIMTTIGSTVTARVAAPRAALFDWFISIPLPRILLKYGPIPSVASTTGQTGPWDVVGNSRIVHLADGHTARESVTGYQRSSYFAYRVSDFDNFLGRLAADAVGRWWFADGPNGSTDITWTYTFNARNRLAAIALLPIVKIFWRGYMRQAVATLSELAVAEARAFRAPTEDSMKPARRSTQ
ncbi:hypothetical protein [Dactylosporangium sp. NPDC006015]|uniref:SRPBCC family protein n=1 Tax=Dactylosporangium sp. NPDC006015 TaxID=3154576 RepID=UPI0033AD15D8